MEQLKTKIKELEQWLKNNHNHPNYNTVLKDKKELESTLKESYEKKQ